MLTMKCVNEQNVRYFGLWIIHGNSTSGYFTIEEYLKSVLQCIGKNWWGLIFWRQCLHNDSKLKAFYGDMFRGDRWWCRHLTYSLVIFIYGVISRGEFISKSQEILINKNETFGEKFVNSWHPTSNIGELWRTFSSVRNESLRLILNFWIIVKNKIDFVLNCYYVKFPVFFSVFLWDFPVWLFS